MTLKNRNGTFENSFYFLIFLTKLTMIVKIKNDEKVQNKATFITNNLTDIVSQQRAYLEHTFDGFSSS